MNRQERYAYLFDEQLWLDIHSVSKHVAKYINVLFTLRETLSIKKTAQQAGVSTSEIHWILNKFKVGGLKALERKKTKKYSLSYKIEDLDKIIEFVLSHEKTSLRKLNDLLSDKFDYRLTPQGLHYLLKSNELSFENGRWVKKLKK